MPLFSVIVPVYQVEAYLRPCVDSILAQSFGDLELILVDDGSPDGCGPLCDGYAEKDGRVAVIHQQNAGLLMARKAGLDAACGEYVCFVDSDDWVDTNWLETIRRCIEENGRPDMVIHGYTQHADGGAEPRPPRAEPGFYGKDRLEREFYPYMLYDSRRPFFSVMIPAYIWTKAGKRELYRAFFGADGRVRLLEDVITTYECMYRADSIYVCGRCLYHYRIRSGSLQDTYYPDYLARMKLVTDYLRAHWGQARDPAVTRQIDAFCAARTVSAVTHDLRHGRGICRTARHIRQDLAETGILTGLCTRGLPLHIRLYIAMLRRGLCLLPAWIAAVKLRLAEGRHIRARM